MISFPGSCNLIRNLNTNNMLNFLSKEWIVLILISLPFILLVYFGEVIPDQVPIHWDLAGEPNAYGYKYTMPLINVSLYIMLLFVPSIDPRKGNYKLFSNSYGKIRMILALFMSTIICAQLFSYLGYDIDLGGNLSLGIYVLFAALGNYLGTFKPNWFIGIRTPWTLESDVVWKKTHILAGKLWFWLSLLGITLNFILPTNILLYVQVTLIGIMVVVPIVHSYLLYKQLPKI